MHEGASSGVKSSRSKSLQEFVPVEVTYSSGDMVIALQEVLSRNLQFHNGTYSKLPDSIKFILDNLQAAYTKDDRKLFQKTLRALEIHLVNLTAQNEAYASHYANLTSEYANIVSENEAYRSHLVNQPNITNESYDPYTSQLFGKEEINSMDKMTIMGIDYAILSLKTQSLLRSTVANLPTDIQFCILESKAMFRSFDLWFKCFKKLVTATIPDPDELDEGDNVFLQLEWEEHFGTSLRVYEKKHQFPGLLINYDDDSYVDVDDSDDDDMDPNWLSQMFEYGFIRFLKLTSHKQPSQLPQIIHIAIRGFERPFVSIRCWNTLSKWEKDNWMNVQPSKHLIFINGYTHQGQWLEGNSHLSFKKPYDLAECWKNYFNNQILEVAQNLWKDYHFIGSTDRISIFGSRTYANALVHLHIADHPNPRSLLIPGKTPEFEPLR